MRKFRELELAGVVVEADLTEEDNEEEGGLWDDSSRADVGPRDRFPEAEVEVFFLRAFATTFSGLESSFSLSSSQSLSMTDLAGTLRIAMLL